MITKKTSQDDEDTNGQRGHHNPIVNHMARDPDVEHLRDMMAEWFVSDEGEHPDQNIAVFRTSDQRF